MGNGIYTALAGAIAQSDALDVTSNNIANGTTTGFKAERLAFREALTRATDPAAAYAAASTPRTDTQVGTFRQTGNPLDLAIEGDAYFAIETPVGVRYTRAGQFQLDGAGQLVTPDGKPVRAVGGGPIVVPPTAGQVSVSPDGSVLVDDAPVGRIELVTIAPENLVREGDTRFIAAGPVGTPPPTVSIVDGTLEGANFNLVRGVIELVKVSRTFEATTRMIDRYRDIDSRTARDIGGPG
jgi:flagellar basal-body rod protein FlgF